MNFSSSMNVSEWAANSTSASFLQPLLVPVDPQRLDNFLDVTGSGPVSVSEEPCGEALSSQTPTAVKLPGSLDALLYIVIVLMFYAFSIVILMVKYIRREREEANIRSYYHEFVSRDKFRTTQYKHKQLVKRIFGGRSAKDDEACCSTLEEGGDLLHSQKVTSKHKNQEQTITRNGNTFSRLLVDCEDENPVKESFTFLSAKNQFCRNGFFGKKFCNKQLCSKCVSESAPTIDWDDGKVSDKMCSKHGHSRKDKDTVEVRVYQPQLNSPMKASTSHKNQPDSDSEFESRYERDNSIFFPIIECDSEKENEDHVSIQPTPYRQDSDDVIVHASYEAVADEPAIVSSCSLEVSELLANMPPLGAASTSNDMDTLDGLSNLDSEADSQSLLNYSASIRGTSRPGFGQNGQSPGQGNASFSMEDRLKDLSDILSERTSLLSCTLSIDDGEDDDAGSSSKHHPTGLSLSHSHSNGKVKEGLRSNGKSILNSLSKSVSSDEEEMMKLLTDITMLTQESGVFKNLKYFLRSFSKHEEEEEVHEKTTLLPRETYFGPGSPKSFYAKSDSAVVPTQCEPVVSHSAVLTDLDSVDDDLMNLDECEDYGNRWGYTYDEEDENYSEGDKSSSFGDYCMGETSDSQIIDLSKPLVRRQLDPATKDGLSRAFIGLDDPWQEDLPPVKKTNPMLAGYGAARKETKV